MKINWSDFTAAFSGIPSLCVGEEKCLTQAEIKRINRSLKAVRKHYTLVKETFSVARTRWYDGGYVVPTTVPLSPAGRIYEDKECHYKATTLAAFDRLVVKMGWSDRHHFEAEMKVTAEELVGQYFTVYNDRILMKEGKRCRKPQRLDTISDPEVAQRIDPFYS